MVWLLRLAIIAALAILLAGCANRIAMVSPASMGSTWCMGNIGHLGKPWQS